MEGCFPQSITNNGADDGNIVIMIASCVLFAMEGKKPGDMGCCIGVVEHLRIRWSTTAQIYPASFLFT